MTKYIACDVETQDLSAKHDPNVPIWCVGFSINGLTFHVIWDAVSTPTLIEGLLSDPDVMLVFHNASFDVAVLRTHGVNVPPGRYVCSLLGVYLWNTNQETALEYWGEKLGFPKIECDDWKLGYTPKLGAYLS